MDWNELNSIQNVKQINSYECWIKSVSFRILVNAFDWIQVLSFQSNLIFNKNEFFIIPLTRIKNETKPMRFNSVWWLWNWMRVNAFCGSQIEKGPMRFNAVRRLLNWIPVNAFWGTVIVRQWLRLNAYKKSENWIPINVECQSLRAVVELNFLSFNPYIILLEFSGKNSMLRA